VVELKTDDELAGSWVAANCSMQRGRGLAGRDGYTRALGNDPAEGLARLLAIESVRIVRWLDLCCGEGRALLEAAATLRVRGLVGRARVTGVDLVDPMAMNLPPEVRLVAGSVSTWQPKDSFDLITCVHGLHYVGDKLAVLARAASWLKEDGLFVANLDLSAIRLADSSPAGRRLSAELRAAGFRYDARTRRIHRRGHADIRLPFRYLGADDSAGPNYTGQPAVHSYYALDPG
jgi:SAM-dependent methyltransferase